MNNNTVISILVMLFSISISSSQTYDFLNRFYGGNQLPMAGVAMSEIPGVPVPPPMPAITPYYQNPMPVAYPEIRAPYLDMPYPMMAPIPARASKERYVKEIPNGIQLIQNYNP